VGLRSGRGGSDKVGKGPGWVPVHGAGAELGASTAKKASRSARRAAPGLQTGRHCEPRSPLTHSLRSGSSRRELVAPVTAARLGVIG